jgi:hypothetical protein
LSPPGHSSWEKIIGQFSIAIFTSVLGRVGDERGPDGAEVVETVGQVARAVAPHERADRVDAELGRGRDHLAQVLVRGRRGRPVGESGFG